MQDIMEEKVEKGFMIINKLVKNLLYVIGFFVVFSSCKDEGVGVFIDDLPPTPFFELSINLNLVSSQNLQFNNHLYIDDAGINGIVVVKRGENDYATFERTCPYQPEDDCSRVTFTNLGTGGSIFICDCEDAIYRTDDGFSTRRPTETPKRLRQYSTQLSGNNLFISSTF